MVVISRGKGLQPAHIYGTACQQHREGDEQLTLAVVSCAACAAGPRTGLIRSTGHLLPKAREREVLYTPVMPRPITLLPLPYTACLRSGHIQSPQRVMLWAAARLIEEGP